MYRKLMFLISLVMLLGLVNVATAADIDWIGAGSFCDPLNWDGGVVPGPGDEARMDCGDGQGNVTIDCDIEVGDMRGPAIEGEDCNQTLDMVSGSVLCASWEGMIEGDNKIGTLNVASGTITVTDDGSSFAFAEDGDDNTHAYINISGDAVLNLGGRWRNGDNGGNAWVDVSGNAIINVQDYARIGDDGAGYWKFRENCSVNFLGEYEDDKTGLQCGNRDNSVDLYVADNAELYVAYTLNANKYSDSVHNTYISGGVCNCDWYLMRSNGNLHVTGGTLICRSKLTMESGSAGDVQVGGTIMASELDVEGVLDLIGTSVSSSGLLILDGYQLPEVFAAVGAGSLKGNGAGSGINADYNVTNPGKTTVWAEVADPKQAYSPFPYNTMVGVGTGSDLAPFTPLVLHWVAGEGLGLGRHYLYFDEDEATVTDPACGGPGFLAMIRASTVTWTPPGQPLDLWKTYYWRVDEVGVSCVKGKVWNFTTGCALIPGDVNMDCVLNFDDYAAVAGTYGGEQLWPE